jgi:hypothetical protein
VLWQSIDDVSFPRLIPPSEVGIYFCRATRPFGWSGIKKNTKQLTQVLRPCVGSRGHFRERLQAATRLGPRDSSKIHANASVKIPVNDRMEGCHRCRSTAKDSDIRTAIVTLWALDVAYQSGRPRQINSDR